MELFWDLYESACLDEKQKKLLAGRIRSRLTEAGILVMSCEEHRSQYRNRQEVTERFIKTVISNLVPPKKRHPTKPTRSSVEERLKNKKRRGEIKRWRGSMPES